MKSSTAAESVAVTLLIGTRKGAFTLKSDRTRRTWKVSRPIFLGQHHSSCRAATRATAAPCSWPPAPAISGQRCFARPTWARPGRKRRAAGVSESAGRRKGRAVVDHIFWLTPGQANEPKALVRRHLAARALPFRRLAASPGSRCPVSTMTRSTARGWVRCRTARQTGRSCTRSWSIRAIPRTSTSAMSGGGVHESRRWRRDLEDRSIKGLDVVEGFDPTTVDLPRPALHPALPEQSGPALSAEPLRHLPDRPAVEPVGAHRQEHAEEGRRHRLSRWSCIRAMLTPPGCFRWTARPCGRASARAASRRPM